ncbi:MAG TPA: hypothetical protein DDW56_09410, partial [Cyanobacteria bacterium UBA11366]|nr:hypothetical protein [Cyanobacteria bacterium UBA11366]
TPHPTPLLINLLSNLDAPQLIWAETVKRYLAGQRDWAGFILQSAFIPGLKTRGFQRLIL